MKFSFTKFAGAAVATAVLLAPAQDLLAAKKRLVVIEEFTSATCGPCVGADPVLAKVVKSENGIISVRYHEDYPAKNDPFNLAFPDGRKVHDKYSVAGIPAAQVNGHYAMDPREESALMAAAKFDQTFIYPVEIKVTENKTAMPNVGVKIDVETGMDLTDYVLHVLVIADYVSLPNLPNTLANSNGQDEFEDAVLTMLPNWQGTAVNIAANEQKSFDFSYTMKSTELWPQGDGEVYVVAFLQNTKTMEIVQAGTSEDIGDYGSLASTSFVRTMPLPGFSIEEPNGQVTTEVTISNNTDAAATYGISKSVRTPADWTASVGGGNTEVTIPAGGQQKVTMTFTKGATTGMGDMVVSYMDGSTPMSVALQSILSKDVETIQLTDDNGDYTYSMANSVAATGRSGYFDVPVNSVLPKLDDLENLKYVVWNTGASGIIDGTEQFYAMDLLDRGVGMLFAGAAQTYGASGDPAASLHSKLGIQYVQPIRQGYSNLIVRLIGVKDDPITDGFKELGTLVNYLTPLIKSTDPNTKVILAHQGFADSTIAARAELDNARAVFFGITPSIIDDADARAELIGKALDWIEGKVAAPRPKAILSANPSEPLDFGKVKVGESHDITMEIQAANAAGLEISDVSDFRENFGSYGITIVGLPSTFPATPITLAEGEKLSFTLHFAPSAVGIIDQGDNMPLLSISTNEEDGGLYNYEIKGEATANTSSVSETESRNGEFSVSAGPNPFVGSSVVRYSLNNGIAKNVRIALFNEQGREVAVLVNSVVLPGEHTAAIDGSNLAAGMYHVVMTVGGESVSLPVVSVK